MPYFYYLLMLKISIFFHHLFISLDILKLMSLIFFSLARIDYYLLYFYISSHVLYFNSIIDMDNVSMLMNVNCLLRITLKINDGNSNCHLILIYLDSV
jgi:hypothetical protein